jgi:hypothetical protein
MMIRRFYVWLLRLHPPRFRQEFAGEMLWIFDQARHDGSGRLIGDAAASLVRQWCFRSGMNGTQALSVLPGGDGVPLFYSASSDGPRGSSLAQGAVVAFALMLGLFVLMGRGQPHGRVAIGSRTPQYGLGVEGGEGAGELTTEVKVKRPDNGSNVGAPRGFLFDYFRLMPVLTALDTDHDLAISNDEINAARTVLGTLDRNQDSELSAEECGFDPPNPNTISPLLGAGFEKRARHWFMRLHPVLAALDTNRDGVLSKVEIATAGAALRTLDWNHDDQLTGPELMPDRILNTLAIYLSRLDLDSDGSLSGTEVAAASPAAREVLRAADRDRDGMVSESELLNEIRRRAEWDADGGDSQLRIASGRMQ